MSKRPRDFVIIAEPAIYRVTVQPVTFWRSDNYAEDWYRDAVAEARSGGGHDARRREIIFASCFAESFIFEWTRHKLKIEEIDDYFPSKSQRKHDLRYRRKLLDKWK